MSQEWKTAASRRTCCLESLLPVQDQLDAHPYALRMFASAILKQAASTSQSSGQPPQTDRNGAPQSVRSPTQLRRGEMPAGRKNEQERNILSQTHPRQPSDARRVADPAALASDFTVTPVAAAPVPNKTTSMVQLNHDLPRSTAPTNILYGDIRFVSVFIPALR